MVQVDYVGKGKRISKRAIKNRISRTGKRAGAAAKKIRGKAYQLQENKKP